MPRNTNTQTNQREQNNEHVVTRSGRVVKQPERYDTLEFLPGSNNRHTRGRLIDRSFSAKGGHTENYVHNYKPRVVKPINLDDLSQFTDDEKEIAEILANSFSRRDIRKHNNKHSESDNESDPDWNPNDDPDATETDDDFEDEVDEGCESEIEVEEPEDDVLTDGDYESNDEFDEDSDDEEAIRRWKRARRCNENSGNRPHLEVVGTRIAIHCNNCKKN
jgi:hypothetical protein